MQSAHPYANFWAVLFAGLACSIGWGIRGNYGHEYGAMFPGAVTALAVCLLSGREDWRQRFVYFAFFGAIGWGFGGSISYMQVISYTHSGHAATQYFGFFGLIVIGSLWAGFGVLGTAVACEFDREELVDLCRAALMIFAVWWLADHWPTIASFVQSMLPLELPVLQLPTGASRRNMSRHEHPLYWFDTDWTAAAIALATLCGADLIQRRMRGLGHLAACLGIGLGIGWALQAIVATLGLQPALVDLLVRPLGDVAAFDKERLLTNWPLAFEGLGACAGMAVGAVFGVLWHFGRRGEFARSLGLPTSMAAGWMAGFLLFPVLLDVRMTPPRGDNWSGILGALMGALLYLWRRGDERIVTATLLGGALGGISFSATAAIKLLMVSIGNPNLTQDDASIARWSHWQSANWHSFLEQTYGFFNGIAVMAAIGFLVRRSPRRELERFPAWSIFAATVFVLSLMSYVNLVKNVADWTRPLAGESAPMPRRMMAPLIGFELSATGWFNVFAASATVALSILVLAHQRRPLALLPENALGKGQWLFLAITWIFVIGNFTKALAGYSQSRLLTEGVITMHAMIASLILLLRLRSASPPEPLAVTGMSILRPASALWLLLAIIVLLPPLEWFAIRSIYGDAHAGHAGQDFRFGPKASWKTRPLLRGNEHR